MSYGSRKTEGFSSDRRTGVRRQRKPVRGVLVLVSAAKKMGFRRCFLPVPNMAEGALVEGIQIIGIKSLLHLQEVVSQDDFEAYGSENVGHNK